VSLAADTNRPALGRDGRAASPGRSPTRGGARAREERALFARYLDTRERADRDVLVERFLPLARQLARRYQRSTEPFDDLFQVACLALVKAIDRFDLSRGTAFSSYAVPTIAGELKRHYRDRAWSVRVPRDLQDLALTVERAVSELSLDLHRQPTVAEIAAHVGATDETVLEALEAAVVYTTSSLDAPRSDRDDGRTLGDSLGCEERGFTLAEDRAMLEQLMSVLTPRDREVLRLRFEEDLTQSEIGERIGVSQMHISRIIRQAIAQLRDAASPHADTPRAGRRNSPPPATLGDSPDAVLASLLV
jgi:RNA polymerase sigma-B factor